MTPAINSLAAVVAVSATFPPASPTLAIAPQSVELSLSLSLSLSPLAVAELGYIVV